MLASLKFVDRFVTLTRVKNVVQTPTGAFERYDFDVQTLAPLLTRQGFEVESVAHFGDGFDAVVVARIEKAEPHPKADKLRVCQVNTGDGLRQIVCGAANAREGLYVAAALVGAKLPGGLEIKAAKIRDVESNGMLCSRAELGLPVNERTDGDGIWELHVLESCGQPEDTLAKMLGVPVFDALGLRDTLLELNVTPNRPDMLCHEGVAREVLVGLARAGVPASWRGHTFVAKSPITAEEAMTEACTRAEMILGGKDFSVENALGVGAFFGGLEGLSVGPSPAWLRGQLEALGQKSVNNVVDASNYVLLAFGQPSHAFDVATLSPLGGTTTSAGGTSGSSGLLLRPARDGETFHALDGKERTLVAQDCVVADGAHVQALLGVIGGEKSKVTDGTFAVALEFANPHPVSVRRSSRRHGRKTDASFLFEKGIDSAARFRALCELVGLITMTQGERGAAAPRWMGVIGSRRALDAAPTTLESGDEVEALGPNGAAGVCVDASFLAARPTSLLAQSAAGKVFGTPEWAAWREDLRASHSCAFAAGDVARLVGAELLSFEDQLRILDSLGFATTAQGSGEVLVRFPHWRWRDISGVPDLVEEVVRVVGIDKIPSTPLVSNAGGPKDDVHLAVLEKVAARTAALGYNEIAGFHFMKETDLTKLGLAGPSALGEPLALINPIIRDQPLMHTSLLPNLLSCVQRNTSFGVPRGLLFHVTRTYQNIDAEGRRVFAANGEGVGLCEAFEAEARKLGTGADLLATLREYAPQHSLAYSREASQAGRPAETPRLGAVAFGPREEKQWNNTGATQWTFLEIASHAVEVGLALGIPLSLVPLPTDHPIAGALHPSRRAHLVTENGEPVGWAGELHPAALRGFEIPTTVVAFELNLAVLVRETLVPGHTRKRVVAPLRFPAVSRDFAFLLSEDVQAGDIVTRVREALTGSAAPVVGSLREVPARLVDVRIFDVYRGKGVAEGKKSVAFNVTVEPLERTLQDKDIQWLTGRVVDAVSGSLGGELRGG